MLLLWIEIKGRRNGMYQRGIEYANAKADGKRDQHKENPIFPLDSNMADERKETKRPPVPVVRVPTHPDTSDYA
jgi:hypothetical protein